MTSCDKCKAECCRYVTIDLATPKDKEDWDEVKWMLLHKNIMVYKDLDGDWQVEFRTPCKHIDPETFKCQIYDKRPQPCKDHEIDECENNDEEWAEVILLKPEDVDKYLKEKIKSN